jgi:hypothetical protein
MNIYNKANVTITDAIADISKNANRLVKVNSINIPRFTTANIIDGIAFIFLWI